MESVFHFEKALGGFERSQKSSGKPENANGRRLRNKEDRKKNPKPK